MAIVVDFDATARFLTEQLEFPPPVGFVGWGSPETDDEPGFWDERVGVTETDT